jgi:HD-like signal output (HDOD) protein
LARAHKHAKLFADRPTLNTIVRQWHANVGKAIVENWGFSVRISEAIGDHEDLERQTDDADLTDVLTVASLLSAFIGKTQDLELNMQGVLAFGRLKLDNEKCFRIMEECAEEIAQLRSALGD